jgi:cystathionine gamma-synthase/methionine-gamma-lyase
LPEPAAPRPGRRAATRAVGLGYDPAEAWGAAKPPIVLTSTFVYPSAQAAKDFHAAFYASGGAEPAGAPDGYIYARLGHPNLTMLETRMASLDNAQACAAFCSGMAAITAVCLTHLRPGDSVVHTRPIYSGTENFLTQVAANLRVAAVSVAHACDEAQVRGAMTRALGHGPLSLVLVETPANPTAALADIALFRRLADEVAAGADRRPVLAVDNTFLGPMLQDPLAHGADLTMTALTKYCGGHSDVLAGSVSGPASLIAPLKELRTILGTHLDPFGCWLLLRSLESLDVRQARAVANARSVATFLKDHPKVAAVTFLDFIAPDSAPGGVYTRQCGAPGSTFSFAIHGGEAEAFRLLDALRILKVAVSLGGSETLICHPATTTHYSIPPERREAGGVTDGVLRLSVGLEHPDDLIDDLSRGLEAV